MLPAIELEADVSAPLISVIFTSASRGGNLSRYLALGQVEHIIS
jgi:hypothetical protein